MRELVLLSFWNSGLGSVRGFPPDGGGLREPWNLGAEAEAAVKTLVAGRLADGAEDPLARLPHQGKIAHLVPEYDGGRTLGDLAVRVLSLRWPDVYPKSNRPDYSAGEWAEMRARFLEISRSRGVTD